MLKSPCVMGIINVTPDSFYPASRVEDDVARAVEMASGMLADGARILDIGGMSSRPGSTPIPESEEIDRVLPVIRAIHKRFPETILSVDTYRSAVAKACLREGATMVNDISGGQLDEGMAAVLAQYRPAYVLMHMRGTPADMQDQTTYNDLPGEMFAYFVEKLRELRARGVYDIVVDPGFGFAKTMEQNYQVIRQLAIFRALGCPIMVGVSRKSTLSRTIGRPVEETLQSTTALHMAALLNGASILRVHDVRAAMDTIAVFNQLRSGNTE